MKIARCQAGHFYDSEKYEMCPFCRQESSGQGAAYRENHTGNPFSSESADEEALSGSPQRSGISQAESQAVRSGAFSYMKWRDAAQAADENRTVMDFEMEELITHMYVTGWLVCVSGPEKGRDYRLRYGFNQIGRSHRMDVCIFEDDEITRGIHCSVVYEKRKNQFLLVPGQGSLTWKDGALVDKPVELLTGDRFQIGGTVLEFIAFCRDDIKWEK